MKRYLAMVLVLISVAWAVAQPQPDPKDLPKITFVAPLGVAPGASHRLTVRGLKLDTATAVVFQEPKTSGRILARSKVSVGSPKEVAIVGDTQLAAEVRIPPDLDGVLLPFAAENRAGRSAPFRLVVDRWPTLAEKEPNDGFRQAQPIAVPQAVEGAISHPLDVDVFRLDGKAGETVVIDVFAARCGTPLDPLLTLYDAAGRNLASADDLPDSVDARLEFTPPHSGPYFVSLQDAHDQGSPAHVYRLVVRQKAGK